MPSAKRLLQQYLPLSEVERFREREETAGFRDRAISHLEIDCKQEFGGLLDWEARTVWHSSFSPICGSIA
jgi:hypothetical protein